MTRVIFVIGLFMSGALNAAHAAGRATGRELAERWWSAKPTAEFNAHAFTEFSAEIAQLDQQELGSLLREIARIGGGRKEGVNLMIGMTLSIYKKRGDSRVVSRAVLDLLASSPAEQLWTSLVNAADGWTNANDTAAVAAIIVRMGELRHPTAAMPVDYGISSLLRSAHDAAIREGRTADAEQLRAIGVARLEKALPDLVKRAHDDTILPQPGWGSMKMFAIYRSSLGEAFDQQLIEAFRRAKLPVFRQLSIIERMEWIQNSAPLAEYLASLLADRGESRLSPAERATAERLRQKLAGTRTGHAAATPPSPPVGAGPPPVPGARPTPASPGPDAPQMPADSTTTSWLIATPVALVVIGAAFTWARRNRRAARREKDSKPRIKP